MRSDSRHRAAPALVLVLALAACDSPDIVLPADGHDSGPGYDLPPIDAPRDPGAAGQDAIEPLDPGATDGTGLPDPGPVGDPGGSQLCIGNQDGRIDAREMPVVLGAAPGFRVNAPGTLVPADPEGTVVNGERVWDFRGFPGDLRTGMFVQAPGDYWFADRFPGATFVSPLSAQDLSILAVYQVSDGSVRLMGVASVDPAETTKTLLVYETPVALFTYPIEPGQSWQVETKFSNAILAGIPNAGKEVYRFTVDGPGALQLPDLTVRGTLRMTIETEQTFMISTSKDPIKSLQYLYLHECIGEVARLIGPSGEDPWAGRAREARALGL